jgi:hypothetical protein
MEAPAALHLPLRQSIHYNAHTVKMLHSLIADYLSSGEH